MPIAVRSRVCLNVDLRCFGSSEVGGCRSLCMARTEASQRRVWLRGLAKVDGSDCALRRRQAAAPTEGNRVPRALVGRRWRHV